MTVGIRLLSEGFMQAYVDFFYLTQETTPSSIEPSDRLIEEQKLNKQKKRSLEQTPQMLIWEKWWVFVCTFILRSCQIWICDAKFFR